MKRFMTMCAVLAAVGGSVYGLDYKAIVTGTTTAWTDPLAWDNGTGGSITVPNSAADTVYIGAGSGNKVSITNATGNVFTMGELVVRSGGIYAWTKSPLTWVIDSSGGKSGNFWFAGGSYDSYNSFVRTYDISGNAYFNVDLNYGTSGLYTTTIIMRGNGKAIKANTQASVPLNAIIDVRGVGVWDNASASKYQCGGKVIVRSGASIGFNAGVSGLWQSRLFIFEDGQANLPPLLSPVDFSFRSTISDNNTQNLSVTGGVTYPRDVVVGSNYFSDTGLGYKGEYVWRMRLGDLTVGRDLIVSIGGRAAGRHWFSTLDNDTAVSRNVTVKRNMAIGFNGGRYTDRYGYNDPDNVQLYGVRLNNSTVEIDCDLTVGNYGTIDFGGATVRLGGNFTPNNPANSVNNWMLAQWKPGTSTIICDGNGTLPTLGRKNQTLTPYGASGLALNNLTIANECGTVSLNNAVSGILLLTGNLRLEKGKFNDNDRAIMFNGPAHTLYWDNSLCTVTGNSLDNVILLPDAVLHLDAPILGSLFKIDNVEMKSGSKLYLDGFNAEFNGQTFLSDQVSSEGVPYTWKDNDGTIYGTLAIPEPATLLLLGTGALGVLGWIRRRRMT